MNNKEAKYIIGQPIICLTVPESCFIVDIDDDYQFYVVEWMIKPHDGFDEKRLSFYVAHKYYKEMEKTNFDDLQYEKGTI